MTFKFNATHFKIKKANFFEYNGMNHRIRNTNNDDE